MSGVQATPVEEQPVDMLPQDFALEQNYPNPFNLSTTIQFELNSRAPVRLRIYNILGREVYREAFGVLSAGRYTIDWNGRDERGDELASGVYLYSLTAGQIVRTRKMVLIK